MPIMRLPKKHIKKLSEVNEIAMGVHAVKIKYLGETCTLPCMGGVVLLPDELIREESDAKRLDGYLKLPWLNAEMQSDVRETLFEDWLHELSEVVFVDFVETTSASPLMFTRWSTPSFTAPVPIAPLGPPPPPPLVIYGHLPFHTKTTLDTVLYRWEQFPVSRCIDQKKSTIAKGTYASPASELPFIATGFGAVARNALPSLLPAVFRWELQPQSGNTLYCGAGVPLYGQSGGGVEVMFPTAVPNRGPIVNPVVIPAL